MRAIVVVRPLACGVRHSTFHPRIRRALSGTRSAGSLSSAFLSRWVSMVTSCSSCVRGEPGCAYRVLPLCAWLLAGVGIERTTEHQTSTLLLPSKSQRLPVVTFCPSCSPVVYPSMCGVVGAGADLRLAGFLTVSGVAQSGRLPKNSYPAHLLNAHQPAHSPPHHTLPVSVAHQVGLICAAFSAASRVSKRRTRPALFRR